METRDHPITGDNFVSMPFGPVASFTYSYMKGQAPTKVDAWSEFVGPERHHVLPLARPLNIDDLDELSKKDLSILSETWDDFSDIRDQFELADWTHKFCPEWRNPNGSSIPIDFATVFKHLGKDNPVDLAEEIQAERSLVSILRGQ